MTADGVTILIAVISSGGLWTFLQFVVGRRADASRLKTDRVQLLADSQAIAQQTALDSSARALAQVTLRCDNCFDELHRLRNAADILVDHFETFLDDNCDVNRLAVRSAIRALRQVL